MAIERSHSRDNDNVQMCRVCRHIGPDNGVHHRGREHPENLKNFRFKYQKRHLCRRCRESVDPIR